MSKSVNEANLEIKTQVNADFSTHTEGVRINNRNLENSHPFDCQCPICKPFYPEGIPSDLQEERRREELEYPTN